jgi:hypothetical protein
MSKFLSLALVVLSSVALTACPGKSDSSSASSSSGSSSGDSGSGDSGSGDSGGTGGGGVTDGMSCPSGGDANEVEDYPVMYVPSINGTTISSVQFQLYLSNADTSGSTKYTDSLTLEVYTCVSPNSSLGSPSTSASATADLYGLASDVTFTFSGGLTIPTNCTGSEVPLAFKLVDNSGEGSTLMAQMAYSSTSCVLDASTSTTEVDESGIIWSYAAVISAN